MYQIDVSSAAPTQPVSTALGTIGFFTDGNAATGLAATVLPAEFLNALMLEMMNAITGAGLTLSKSSFNQLYTAIKAIGQSGSANYAADFGVANAYAATFSPTVSAPADGMVRVIKVKAPNTGASTFILDGSGTAYPIYGLGGVALQGGELVANGIAVLRFNASLSTSGAWVLYHCSGGAMQIPAATQSGHAAQFGQVNPGRLLNVQVFLSSATYTPTAGMSKAIVEVVGGGGGSGGAPATGAGGYSGSPGASSGTYAKVLLTAAQIGASQAVTIGAAGGGGAAGSSTGGNGGATSFGSLISCPGGLGSSSYGPTATALNVAGSASVAVIPTISAGIAILQNRGNQGGPAIGGTSGGVIAGAGAVSPMEASATGPGAGAGGTAAGANASAQAGFAGAVGKVIVWEYA